MFPQQGSQMEVRMDDAFYPGMQGAYYKCEILEEGERVCKCQIVGDADQDMFLVPRDCFFPIRESKEQDEWPVGSRVEVGYKVGSPMEPLGWWPAQVTEQVGPRIVRIKWSTYYEDDDNGAEYVFHSHCLRDAT